MRRNRIRGTKPTESFLSGGEKSRPTWDVTDGVLQNLDAVGYAIQDDVTCQRRACRWVRLERKDAAARGCPPCEGERVNAHVRADVQAHLTRPRPGFHVTPHLRLVDFRKVHAVSGFDPEFLVVDRLQQTPLTG